MKKIIFLLLMALLLAGVVSAQHAAGPPGVTLDATMFSYGVDDCIITLNTVPSQYDFVLAGFISNNKDKLSLCIDNTVVRKRIYEIKPLVPWQTTDYWLRL